MLNDTHDSAHLRRAIADLVGIAQSDLPPADKLALLCTQIGTLAFWIERMETEAIARPPVPQPHWGAKSSEVRRPS